MSVFDPGARVDILIPAAEVISHGLTTIHFTLPGVPDRTFALPIRDERAREVIVVDAAVPRPVAGEVYAVIGAPGQRLVAFNDNVNEVVNLFDPVTNEWYTPRDAVLKYGPLHLAVPMPEPEPVQARAVVPVLDGVDAPQAEPVP